ncbi:MAG: FHA domain-containing protein [Deltaproteobacteria bacterium]|nr:FHA domain-containing protein [Deltaproteobacteria bacterium]
MPRLVISEGEGRTNHPHDCLEPVITIGRSSQNTIVLPKATVSREHAKIVAEDGTFLAMDLGSENGTELNGRRLAAHEKNLLRHGDVLTIPPFQLTFMEREDKLMEAMEEEITGSDVLEVKLLKTVLSALDREMLPSFEVLNGVDEGKKFHLTDDVQELTIGRDPDAGVSINEHVISRHHAKIIKRWGGIAIRDLDSKNGTFLNNRRIVEEILHDGDRIALGTIVVMFRNPKEINLAEIEATARPRTLPVTAKDVPLAAQDEPPPPEQETPHEDISEDMPPETSLPPAYPTPHPKTLSRLTPLELGLLGLGSLVLIFALITLVNILLA